MSENWQPAVAADEVDEDVPVAVEVQGTTIAIFLVDGEYYATQDTCTHAEASLSEGWVEDDVVECPLHQSIFSIPTGECLTPPADQVLVTYPVRVDDGQILVDIDE